MTPGRRYYREIMRRWALLWKELGRPEQLRAALTYRNLARSYEQMELIPAPVVRDTGRQVGQ